MEKLNKVENDSLEMNQKELKERYSRLLKQNKKLKRKLIFYKDFYEVYDYKIQEFQYDLKSFYSNPENGLTTKNVSDIFNEQFGFF